MVFKFDTIEVELLPAGAIPNSSLMFALTTAIHISEADPLHWDFGCAAEKRHNTELIDVECSIVHSWWW